MHIHTHTYAYTYTHTQQSNHLNRPSPISNFKPVLHSPPCNDCKSGMVQPPSGKLGRQATSPIGLYTDLENLEQIPPFQP